VPSERRNTVEIVLLSLGIIAVLAMRVVFPSVQSNFLLRSKLFFLLLPLCFCLGSLRNTARFLVTSGSLNDGKAHLSSFLCYLCQDLIFIWKVIGDARVFWFL
jgi:hypothetical protein